MFYVLLLQSIGIAQRGEHFAIQGWGLGFGADVGRGDAGDEGLFFADPVEKRHPRFGSGQTAALLNLLDIGSVRGGKAEDDIQVGTRGIGFLQVVFQQ